MTAMGKVYLVGAGPGNAGLITVRGMALLRLADVVAVDRLAPPELLAEVRFGAEIIHVGKSRGRQFFTQDEIHELLIDRAKRGAIVVRLKGGDPFVFGRGFEERQACIAAGVPCDVIPGVSSAIAGPAWAGIPVTHRGLSRGFLVVSAESSAGAKPLDCSALGNVETIVVLMGRARLAEIVEGLLRSGRDLATPTACIQQATTPQQRVVCGSLGDIVRAVDEAGMQAPMIVVIGDVAQFACVTVGGVGIAEKRIVITRPRSTSGKLADMLLAAGAVPILCPLLRYGRPPNWSAVDREVDRLSNYDWVAFTSAQGVRSFWKRLAAAGLDSRALGRCKTACVGVGTAAALRRRGVLADLAPSRHSGRGLAELLIQETLVFTGKVPNDSESKSAPESQTIRVLLPRSDIAGGELPALLRGAGLVVTEVAAYCTQPRVPSAGSLDAFRNGVDAVVFHSPSAVRSYVVAGLPTPPAVVCIGPTTALEAKTQGLEVSTIADRHDDNGVFAALTEWFSNHAVAV